MAELDFDEEIYDDTESGPDGGIYYGGGSVSYRSSSPHDPDEDDEDGELYDVVEDMSMFFICTGPHPPKFRVSNVFSRMCQSAHGQIPCDHYHYPLYICIRPDHKLVR